MKIFNMLCITSLIAVMSTPALAINLNLYEQPKKDAKIVGTLDSETGIIPIFTPKNSDWVKVADPRNGNVGWITSSELKSSNIKGSDFSFRVISTGSGPNSYKVIQFGTPQPMPSAQARDILKKMELKQKELQKDMQKMMGDLFDQAQVEWANIPILFPIMATQQPPATATTQANIKKGTVNPPKVENAPKK